MLTFILQIHKGCWVCITAGNCRWHNVQAVGKVSIRALIEFLDGLAKSLGERYADSFSTDQNSKERSRSVQENSPSTSAKEPKLLDQLRHKMRMLHVATRTEEAYIA